MVELQAMEPWAIIRTGAKQYKVSAGQTISIEKVMPDKNGNVAFLDVLAAKNESKVLLGTPLADKVSVVGKLVENYRGPKIRVVKFKSKSRYRKVQGHRQNLSRVKIEKIEL